jgi:hypothetical protein
MEAMIFLNKISNGDITEAVELVPILLGSCDTWEMLHESSFGAGISFWTHE